MSRTIVFVLTMLCLGFSGTAVSAQSNQTQDRWFRYIPPASNDGFVDQVRVLDGKLALAAVLFEERSDWGLYTLAGVEKGFRGKAAGLLIERIDPSNRVVFYECGVVRCENAATQVSLMPELGYDSDLSSPGASAYWGDRFRFMAYAKVLIGNSIDRNPRRGGLDAVGFNTGLFKSFESRDANGFIGLPWGHLQITGLFEYPLHDYDDEHGNVREAGFIRHLYNDNGNWKVESRATGFGELNAGRFINGWHSLSLKPYVFASEHFQRDDNVNDSFGDDIAERMEVNAGFGGLLTFTLPRDIRVTDGWEFSLPCVLSLSPGIERSIPVVNVGNRNAFTTGQLWIECRR